jgi:hypothetical protein
MDRCGTDQRSYEQADEASSDADGQDVFIEKADSFYYNN